MNEVHASFLVDLEAKKYADGLRRIEDQTKGASARMVADMDATAKATERMGASASRAAMGIRSLGGGNLGAVSLQAQDIAVSLQNGASAATVFAQQGSQLASIFGPGGMIIGGVVAIGAAIYSWVSGIKEANEEAKRLMSSLGELQKAEMAKRDAAVANNRTADRMNISGRTEIVEIRQRFDDERKKMQEDFENIPAHRRDWALHDVAMAALNKRQKAAEDEVYERRDEEFRKKEEAAAEKAAKEEERRISELQSFEKQQHDQFQRHREQKLSEFERMQEREISRVSDFERKEAAKNEKLGDLRGQLSREQQKAAIDKSAVRGQSILDDISNQKEGISSADIRKSAIRAANEEKRAIDRQLAKEGVGQGLSGKEREAARARRAEEIRGDIGAAKNKEKMKAEIDGDSIKKLTDAIEKLIAK